MIITSLFEMIRTSSISYLSLGMGDINRSHVLLERTLYLDNKVCRINESHRVYIGLFDQNRKTCSNLF